MIRVIDWLIIVLLFTIMSQIAENIPQYLVSLIGVFLALAMLLIKMVEEIKNE